MKYLIYAAYGSNLLKERFMVYIKGGCFEGKEYEGCKDDKTEPEDLGWLFVPYRLYFAKKSSRWDNMGVAFLSCKMELDANYHTVVRLWKVSKIQFEAIHEQEGKSWYPIILHLSEKDGLEIKTITGCWENEINNPSERYLEIIKKGLKETTSWSDKEIADYINKFLCRGTVL